MYFKKNKVRHILLVIVVELYLSCHLTFFRVTTASLAHIQSCVFWSVLVSSYIVLRYMD